jgi:glutamyl/glutaminyl-tRNA synthetase
MNQQYIQLLSDDELKTRILNYSEKAKQLNDKTLDDLIPLLKSRMEVLSDFNKLTGIFFSEFAEVDFSKDEIVLAGKLKSNFEKIVDWQHEVIFSAIKECMTSFSVRMPVIYKILTGTERGLPLPQTLEILGKDKTINRLKEVLG